MIGKKKTSIDKGYYCIHLQDKGDITLRLKEEFLSPANLFSAALDFLSEHPDMYLGTSVEHSTFTNIIQAAFISNGRLDVQFHTKENSAAYQKTEGYRLLDHATLQAVLNSMGQLGKKLRQLAEDDSTRH